MAQTQTIRCVKCGTILGTINNLTGDYRGITFNQKMDKLEKEVAKIEGKPDKTIKKTVTKAGFRVNEAATANLNDETKKTVTCACGQVNGIY